MILEFKAMNNSNQLKVFYDSRCIICDEKVKGYRKLNDATNNKSDSVTWLDIYKNQAALQAAGISFTAAKAALQVVDSRGNIHNGVKAHIQLWKELDSYRRLAIAIERIPGFYALCCLYYQGFLAYRYLRNQRIDASA